MYVILDLDELNIHNVFYLEKVKNTVMADSDFLRIIYSNQLFTLNGIFIKFNLNLRSIEKSFNKYKCLFDINQHRDILSKISAIEKNIMNKHMFGNKTPVYRISEQLNNGYLKIFNEIDSIGDTCEFIVKIHGIWENEFEYGLTYKFITPNSKEK